MIATMLVAAALCQQPAQAAQPAMSPDPARTAAAQATAKAKKAAAPKAKKAAAPDPDAKERARREREAMLAKKAARKRATAKAQVDAVAKAQQDAIYYNTVVVPQLKAEEDRQVRNQAEIARAQALQRMAGAAAQDAATNRERLRLQQLQNAPAIAITPQGPVPYGTGPVLPPVNTNNP